MEYPEPQATGREKQQLLSAEIGQRLAAIDIGSNSIRLIVAEPLRGGSYRVLDEEKISARLGQGLNKTGRLDSETMEKALVGLKRMKQIAEGFDVTLHLPACRGVNLAPEDVDTALEEMRSKGVNIEG